MTTVHKWKFFKIARTIQPALLCGADISALSTLDKKYWSVLSSPVSKSDSNAVISALLDTDKDGRVRIPEVLEAVEWLKPRLSSLDVLFQKSDALLQNEINSSTSEGKKILTLFNRLSGDAGKLTHDDCLKEISNFTSSAQNGDSIINASCFDAKYTAIFDAVVTVTGGTVGVDGVTGISQENISAFLDAEKKYKTWLAEKPIVEKLETSSFSIADVANLMGRVAGKIDDFFLSCSKLRYNPALNDALTANAQNPNLTEAPIALPSAAKTELHFETGINPFHRDDIANVAMLTEILCDNKGESLTEELWEKLKTEVTSCITWTTSRPTNSDVFENLTIDDSFVDIFSAAILADSSQAELAASFTDLNRLIVYRTGFLRYLKNFVNMTELYPPIANPSYLVGTLFMDGRACKLSFPIGIAPAAHAAAAANSKACMAYCEISRPATGEKQTVCTVFTAGAVSTLAVGRNGIFVDNEGRDWEAKLVHLVANPMSLNEAFWEPWRKIGLTLRDFLQKFVASKNDSATGALSTAITAGAEKATTAKPATPPTNSNVNGLMMTSSLAAVGIAVGLVGSALAGLVSLITSLPIWKTACGVVAIILLVSVPSVLLTWFKLRARDLSPILNASSWAINRRIGLTASLSKFFTTEAKFTASSFIQGNCRRNTIIVLLLILTGTLVAGWFFCPLSPRNRSCQTEMKMGQTNSVETVAVSIENSAKPVVGE